MSLKKIELQQYEPKRNKVGNATKKGMLLNFIKNKSFV